MLEKYLAVEKYWAHKRSQLWFLDQVTCSTSSPPNHFFFLAICPRFLDLGDCLA